MNIRSAVHADPYVLFAKVVGCPEADGAEDVIEARFTLEVGIVSKLSAVRTANRALSLVNLMVLFYDGLLVWGPHEATWPADGAQRHHPVMGLFYVKIEGGRACVGLATPAFVRLIALKRSLVASRVSV